MSEDKKVGKMPSLKKLKQFIDRGGYAVLESVGEGETPGEKQISGWEKHGIFVKLREETKVSRPTLYRIEAWYPTFESTGMPKGIWIKEEDYKQLKDVCSNLKDVERLMKGVRKYFDHCLIIDLLEFRMEREILGASIESLQLALKKQLEAGKNERSAIEEVLDDVLRNIHRIWLDLHFVVEQ